MANKTRNKPRIAGTGWEEVFLGASKEVEDDLIRKRFAAEINRIQRDVRHTEGRRGIKRAQHSKILAGTTNALFQILPDLPEELRVGLFQPGRSYRAHVRFSNASSFEQPDLAPDLRGIALRVKSDAGPDHDFLMTNSSYSHARDARQFMIVAASVTREGRPAALWRLPAWRTLAAFVRLSRRLGLKEAVRILRTTRKQRSRPVASLATEQYWSRAPYAFGEVAVKFKLEPITTAATAATARTSETATEDLRRELISRLDESAVQFDFKVQRYVDAERTPIEDGTIEWKEEDSPFTTIASLVIPKQKLEATDEQAIEGYAFNPWNTGSTSIRPLGSLNRARKLVYHASARFREGTLIAPQ